MLVGDVLDVDPCGSPAAQYGVVQRARTPTQAQTGDQLAGVCLKKVGGASCWLEINPVFFLVVGVDVTDAVH